MLLPTGMIARNNVNLNAKITSYNNDLVKLQDRMAKLLATYTQQFSIMDSIIGQGKTTRDGMKSTFDGMMAAYNK
jgi:flagellar capping protein FliD